MPCVLQGDEEAEDLGSGEHGQNKQRGSDIERVGIGGGEWAGKKRGKEVK
jgi:hypothetical protein